MTVEKNILTEIMAKYIGKGNKNLIYLYNYIVFFIKVSSVIAVCCSVDFAVWLRYVVYRVSSMTAVFCSQRLQCDCGLLLIQLAVLFLRLVHPELAV